MRSGALVELPVVRILLIEGERAALRSITVTSVEAQVGVLCTVEVARFEDLAFLLAKPVGHFTLVLRAGDCLTADALQRCCAALDSGADMVYTDHDSVLKPAWSPELLRAYNYVGPLCVVRSDLLAKVVVQAKPSSMHGLMLAVSEQARSVVHVPRSLVVAGAGLTPEVDSGEVAAHLLRVASEATPVVTSAGKVRLEPNAEGQERLVSIVMLTGGAHRMVGGQNLLLVKNAVESVSSLSTYTKVEIVVVLDRNAPESLGEDLAKLDSRVKIVRDHNPFNFAAANNVGVANASGEVLVFLNDDTQVITPNWIERLLMYLSLPGVGIVGPKLLYGDGRIQHAGIRARDGYVEHQCAGYLPDSDHALANATVSTNVLAVTGACLAIETTVFDEVDGFNEAFPLNFNDIDLCLKVRRTDREVVVDLETTLLHLESASRESGISKAEQELFNQLWAAQTHRDPYSHPSYVQVRTESVVAPPALSALRSLVEASPVLASDPDPSELRPR